MGKDVKTGMLVELTFSRITLECQIRMKAETDHFLGETVSSLELFQILNKLQVSEEISLKNNKICRIVYLDARGLKLTFENRFCSFVPIGWANIDNIWYPLSYKLVTEDLLSLGLRKNPTRMEFPLNEWIYLPIEKVVPGSTDFGGIWSARRKGSTTTLRKHCLRKHAMKTRLFITALYNPVFSNDYGIKSQGVLLLKEVKNETNI